MLAKRIIPCLDVKAGKVVKGVQFKQHQVVGEIEQLAQYYNDAGADELVFYDITASSDNRCVQLDWIRRVAQHISIPFCVAGGIRTLADAERILAAGADKISINSPAIENPNFITQLAQQFGQQCVVVGIDSYCENQQYWVYQYTGDEQRIRRCQITTQDWIKRVEQCGAGEIVLNCMNQDGMRQGYAIKQCQQLRLTTSLPLIASGGAGCCADFAEVFIAAGVDGALAASVFHQRLLTIAEVKNYCRQQNIEVRLC